MAWTGLTIALLLVPQRLDAKCQTERNQEAVSTEDHRGHTLWPERGSGIKTGGNENDIERERCRVVSFGVSSRWLQAAASPAGPLSRPFSPLPSNLPPSPQKSTTLNTRSDCTRFSSSVFHAIPLLTAQSIGHRGQTFL